jgi:hypothetical protein
MYYVEMARSISASGPASRETKIDALSKHSRLIAYAVSLAFAVVLLLANVRQEYSLNSNGDFEWTSPLFLYVAIGIYFISVILFCYRLQRGQLLAAAIILCPLLTIDLTCRILFQPMLPAASFVLIAAVGAWGVYAHRRFQLNRPTILFLLVAAGYFLAWMLRGDWRISNADIQYLSFALLLIFFSNLTRNIERSNEVLITLAYCLAITTIPALWQYTNMLLVNPLWARLSYLENIGANSLAVCIGLGVLIIFLTPLNPLKVNRVVNIAVGLFLIICLLLTGSRGQVLVVFSIGILSLMRVKRLFMFSLAILIIIVFIIYSDLYSIQRLVFFDPTLTGRVENLKIAIESIGQHPWIGIGPYAWKELCYNSTNKVIPVHNPILAPWVDGGLLCALFNILFIISIFIIAFSFLFKRNKTIIAYGWLLIAAFSVHLSAYYYAYLPFAVIGICLTPLQHSQFRTSLKMREHAFLKLRKMQMGIQAGNTRFNR